METTEEHGQPENVEKSHKIWQALSGRRSGEVAFAGVIFLLVLVTGYAAYANVIMNGWTADAAGWAQASGSIVAVAGAAWLAQAEARRSRRARREYGEEAAWSVRFVIAQAQFDAQIIAAELTSQENGFGSSDIKAWRQRAANASLALHTMLTRVDHIHPAVVVSATNAKILVDSLSRDLEKIEDVVKHDEIPCDQLIADIVYAHLNLSQLVENFDARMRGVREALDRGGDMLPVREWLINERN